MRQVNLGGTKSSAQGFGCMSLSQIFGGIDEEQSIKVFHHAVSKGVTHFDTALAYGDSPGANETMIGKALKGCGTPREELVIATKVGISVDLSSGSLQTYGKPQQIRDAFMGCLERLGVEYVDILYLHRIDTATPIVETVGEMKKLVEEGKVRGIGLSEASAKTIRAAHEVHPVTAVQLEWSLFARDSEKEIIPVCRELGIGIVAYSPLGSGMLTGKFKTREDAGQIKANLLPKLNEENFDRNRKAVEKIEAFAKEKGCTPGQLSLAWVMAQGDDVCPIPGTSKIKNLDSNLAANDVVLNKEEVQRLSDMVPHGTFTGERSPPSIPTHKDN